MTAALAWIYGRFHPSIRPFVPLPRLGRRGSTLLENFQRKDRKHPDQMPQPPQLSMWRSWSIPSSVQMYELSISQAEPSHPTNQLLYPRSHSFSRYPKLVTKVEGWNADCLPSHLDALRSAGSKQLLLCQNSCKHATSDRALEPWQVMARNQTYHSCWEGTLNIFVSFCNSSLHHVAHSIVFSKLLVTAVVSIMSTLDSRGVDYTLEYRQVIYGFWWSQITLRKA